MGERKKIFSSFYLLGPFLEEVPWNRTVIMPRGLMKAKCTEKMKEEEGLLIKGGELWRAYSRRIYSLIGTGRLIFLF